MSRRRQLTAILTSDHNHIIDAVIDGPQSNPISESIIDFHSLVPADPWNPNIFNQREGHSTDRTPHVAALDYPPFVIALCPYPRFGANQRGEAHLTVYPTTFFYRGLQSSFGVISCCDEGVCLSSENARI